LVGRAKKYVSVQYGELAYVSTWAPNLQSNIKRFTAVTLALYDALIGENKIPLEIAGLIFIIVHQTQADGSEKEYSAEEDK
jgi:hypothetical protein